MAYSNYRDNDLYQNSASSALLQQSGTVKRYDVAGLQTDAIVAEEKRREIEEVEVGVNEIAECQKEIAKLVEDSGPKLQQAADNIGDAADKTAEGVGQLQTANKHAKSARKRMCCALVLLAVIGMPLTHNSSINKNKPLFLERGAAFCNATHHPQPNHTVGIVVLVVSLK